MLSVVDLKKSNSRHRNVFILVLFIFSSVYSCKVTETKIHDVVDSSTTWFVNQDSVYILCSTHYLKYFDKIHNSKKSPFKSDSVFAQTLVYNGLKDLYSADSLILKKFVLCATPNNITTDTFINIQIHVYTNWWKLIPMFPVRESVCVKSSILTKDTVIRSHEEWGYRRTLGEFYDESTAYGECDQNEYNLRLYCVKKSIVELMKVN
jgi:hypothetical protein